MRIVQMQFLRENNWNIFKNTHNLLLWGSDFVHHKRRLSYSYQIIENWNNHVFNCSPLYLESFQDCLTDITDTFREKTWAKLLTDLKF